MGARLEVRMPHTQLHRALLLYRTLGFTEVKLHMDKNDSLYYLVQKPDDRATVVINIVEANLVSCTNASRGEITVASIPATQQIALRLDAAAILTRDGSDKPIELKDPFGCSWILKEKQQPHSQPPDKPQPLGYSDIGSALVILCGATMFCTGSGKLLQEMFLKAKELKLQTCGLLVMTGGCLWFICNHMNGSEFRRSIFEKMASFGVDVVGAASGESNARILKLTKSAISLFFDCVDAYFKLLCSEGGKEGTKQKDTKEKLEETKPVEVSKPKEVQGVSKQARR